MAEAHQQTYTQSPQTEPTPRVCRARVCRPSLHPESTEFIDCVYTPVLAKGPAFGPVGGQATASFEKGKRGTILMQFVSSF